MNKNILWIIVVIILGVATVYGTIWYLKQRDMKLWEKMREESKIEEIQESIEEKTLEESLPLPTAGNERVFYEENKELLKTLPSPQEKPKSQTEAEKLLKSLPAP